MRSNFMKGFNSIHKQKVQRNKKEEGKTPQKSPILHALQRLAWQKI
jgi:hypothetical protein